MEKKVSSWVLPVLAAVILTVAAVTPAIADKAFRDQFKAAYVKPDSTEPKDVALREAFQEAGCNLCHVGDNRQDRNAYGQALAKFLNRKTDAKNKAKIRAALEKVAAQRSKPDDPQSPTFGDLIGQGKLPAGNTK